MRETLEMGKAKLDENIKMLNRGNGTLNNTDTWTPLFMKMIKTDVAEKQSQDNGDVK